MNWTASKQAFFSLFLFVLLSGVSANSQSRSNRAPAAAPQTVPSSSNGTTVLTQEDREYSDAFMACLGRPLPNGITDDRRKEFCLCTADGYDDKACGALDVPIDPDERASRGSCTTENNKPGTKKGGICVEDEEEPKQSAADACETAFQSAQSECVENSSMNTAMNAASAIMGSNVKDKTTCGTLAAAQAASSGAIGTFGSMCKDDALKCVETCSASDPDTRKKKSTCTAQLNQAKKDQSELASGMARFAQATQACEAAFGSMEQQAQSVCMTNPALCQPTSLGSALPVTGTDMAGGTGATLNNGGMSSSTGETGSSGTAGLDLDDDRLSLDGMKPNAMGEDPGGAKGGGSVGATGGGAGGGAGGGGRGKGEGLLSNILSGFFGSGGGSGGSGGGGWRSLFGGGNDKQAAVKKETGPDLRKFLPGAMNDPLKNRGIAGQFVGKDGMLGPHANIWKQINNRYQYKRASLLP